VQPGHGSTRFGAMGVRRPSSPKWHMAMGRSIIQKEGGYVKNITRKAKKNSEPATSNAEKKKKGGRKNSKPRKKVGGNSLLVGDTFQTKTMGDTMGQHLTPIQGGGSRRRLITFVAEGKTTDCEQDHRKTRAHRNALAAQILEKVKKERMEQC